MKFSAVVLAAMLLAGQETNVEEWSLGDAPISGAESIAVLEFYSEGKPLAPNLPPPQILEGKATLGRPRIGPVPPLLPLAPSSVGSPAGWDRYMVALPFSIHPPPADKLYKELRFFVSLKEPRASAFALFPRELLQGGKSPAVIYLRADGSFEETGRRQPLSGTAYSWVRSRRRSVASASERAIFIGSSRAILIGECRKAPRTCCSF